MSAEQLLDHLVEWTVSECVGFNIPLNIKQVISEMSLSRQSLHWYWQPKKPGNETLHIP